VCDTKSRKEGKVKMLEEEKRSQRALVRKGDYALVRLLSQGRSRARTHLRGAAQYISFILVVKAQSSTKKAVPTIAPGSYPGADAPKCVVVGHSFLLRTTVNSYAGYDCAYHSFLLAIEMCSQAFHEPAQNLWDVYGQPPGNALTGYVCQSSACHVSNCEDSFVDAEAGMLLCHIGGLTEFCDFRPL
jgi:hypothetical protein